MSIFTRVLAIFCIICSVTPSGFCYLFLYQQGLHPCLCSVALSGLNVDGVQGLPPAFVLLPFQGLMLMVYRGCPCLCPVALSGLNVDVVLELHPCLCSVALSGLNVDGVQGLPPAFVLLPFQGLMLMLSWSCTPACVHVQGLHPSLYSIALSWLHNPHKMYKVALRDLIH